KSFAIDKVLFDFGASKVFYFDTDIQLYSRLDRLARALDACNVLLTAHLTAPLPDDGKAPDDLHIKQCGVYNGGFLGVRHSQASREALKWLQGKMRKHCIVNIPEHLFVDQSWLDMLPAMFEGVGVERHPGCNVAFWNL